MDLKEFARQVRDMRSWQKRYFAGEKTSTVLDQSKRREREVDRTIAEILDGQGKLGFREGGDRR